MTKTILIASIAATALVASVVYLLAPHEVEARPLAAACRLQAWPYYDGACVRDHREGHAHQVRIVAIDRLPITTPVRIEK